MTNSKHTNSGERSVESPVVEFSQSLTSDGNFRGGALANQGEKMTIRCNNPCSHGMDGITDLNELILRLREKNREDERDSHEDRKNVV